MVKRVFRRKGEALNPKCTNKTIKHGGVSVMVWGCFNYNGVGQLEFIDIMTVNIYQEILLNNIQLSAHSFGPGNNFIWQEDNNPKHSSKM